MNNPFHEIPEKGGKDYTDIFIWGKFYTSIFFRPAVTRGEALTRAVFPGGNSIQGDILCYNTGSKKLFISYKTHKPITRDTISNWIVKTIKMSYDNLEGVRAHDVRSLSTSWALFKSVPVNEIMEAASWKAETTFTSFYLNDMCSRGKFGKTVLSAASLS